MRKRRNSPGPGVLPPLDAHAGHVTEFTKVLSSLHGDRLDDDQPDPHSFAYGIKRDQQAVLNRLVDLFTVHA